MNLKLLEMQFAVLKLDRTDVIPSWAIEAEHFFISKTSDELSIICPEVNVPAEMKASKGWCCFRVNGELEFEEVGVVATVSRPIADAGISLFLVSTHDRDYVFVHADNFENAIKIYEAVGFVVTK